MPRQIPVGDAPLKRPVWDLPTRVVHWLLAALITFSWWSVHHHHTDWHIWSGIAILTLLLFRLMPAINKFDAFPARRRANPSSFLTVQEGCDKFCTYCVVPYTRGAEISRPWNDIVAEAYVLVDAGAREIVLLGQNVNAWADGDRGLAELIRALAKIDGLERIRYTTSHPADMSLRAQ